MVDDHRSIHPSLSLSLSFFQERGKGGEENNREGGGVGGEKEIGRRGVRKALCEAYKTGWA